MTNQKHTIEIVWKTKSPQRFWQPVEIEDYKEKILLR